jgi:glycine cleavage system aminomethyltransferase T
MTFATVCDLRFAVHPHPGAGLRPNELTRTMSPHPLMYQEMPYNPEYTIYNGRLTPAFLDHATADEMYWKVRREVVLRHTGELPLEIVGPDAVALLQRVFTRDVSTVRVGRCSYQFACYHDGGMITDGVLVRLADDRFWFGQADGDLYSWFRAHAEGLDVRVFNPDVWISQVQGPRSLEVLDAVVDGPMSDRFNYFDMAEVTIAGQPVVITRTGFSNELGWEFYVRPDIDAAAVGDRILSVGESYGMIITSTDVFRARRIEAGLLNAGSDFDMTTSPFDVGLGAMVDFDKGDFSGRSALLAVQNSPCRTWGMRIDGSVANLGRVIVSQSTGEIVGKVCSSGWSPFQECGVAIVRFDSAEFAPGDPVAVACIDGTDHDGTVCTLPMIDPDRLIPRGKLVDVPSPPHTLAG